MPPRSQPPVRAAKLRELRLTTLAILCSTLAACGGGGGGGSGPKAAVGASAGTTTGTSSSSGAGTSSSSSSSGNSSNSATSSATGTGNGGGNSANPNPPPVVDNNPPPVANDAANMFTPQGINQPLTSPAAPSALLQPTQFRDGLQATYYNSINLKPARDQNLTGRGVAVAVVDSGIRSDTLWVNVDRSLGGDYNNGVRSDAVEANQQSHGGQVATALAGQIQPLEASLGGIAPDVTLYSANVRIPGLADASTANVITAWTDLSQRGVRLLNTSLSTPTGIASILRLKDYRLSYSTATDATRPLTMVGGALTAVNNGALIVLSAGNGDPVTRRGHDQPAAEALLPQIEPDLQRGLIAAVAANSNGVIEDWADRCGDAAQWCMAANSHTYLKQSPNDRRYTILPGSSFATPQIVGTAALLLQKYPWMSNDNLRTALLTTATDQGAPGVDPVYGWGLLNVGRAINGPAQFAFGDFQAQLQRDNGQWGSYEFRNDISGAGGLQLSGEGTLILAGNNSYTGETSVNGGILDVAGSITSTTRIAPGGTLTGLGSTGAVINDGAVYSSGQGLRIRGDY